MTGVCRRLLQVVASSALSYALGTILGRLLNNRHLRSTS